MKTLRALAFIGAVLLAAISYRPHWPAALWAWLAALSYDPNWPILALFWLFCPNPNWIGGGCGQFTAGMKLLRLLVVGAPILAGVIAFRLRKSKRRKAQRPEK